MQEFFDNLARYPRFLISVSLGIFFALFEKLKPLFSTPLTAFATIGVLVGFLAFLVFTLRAMLGFTPV